MSEAQSTALGAGNGKAQISADSPDSPGNVTRLHAPVGASSRQDRDNDNNVGFNSVAGEPIPAQSTSKRIFDLFGASAALVFFAPIMAIIYLIVRADGGNAIFIQKRVGRDGRLFDCYKFRSMALNAEELLEEMLEQDEAMAAIWEEDRKLRDDPRITKIGGFLRKKSLDELPQLFNVIKGDMSLVGPRPIVPDERAKYGEAFCYYTLTRPGLTGAWQVSGRNDVSYEERVALDVDYAKGWNWVTDIKILFKTVGVVLTGKGAL